ncbi:MAG: GNAT family N-acetyltransferase [Faecousia sp.]
MNHHDYLIRSETPADYRIVEELTREAFWNQYVPGCTEHYLVNQMHTHPDFVPELAFVLEKDGQILGSILYTRSKLVSEAGEEKTVLTFGPISVRPGHQRKGYGKALIEHSFEAARSMGYDTVVILGDPGNYVSRGFKSCKKYNVCFEGDVFAAALLVKELAEGALDGRRWYFHESPVCNVCADDAAVAAFDATFPPKEKHWQPSQEVFYIQSHSTL